MVQSLSLNRGTALPFYKTIEFATPAHQPGMPHTFTWDTLCQTLRYAPRKIKLEGYIHQQPTKG